MPRLTHTPLWCEHGKNYLIPWSNTAYFYIATARSQVRFYVWRTRLTFFVRFSILSSLLNGSLKTLYTFLVFNDVWLNAVAISRHYHDIPMGWLKKNLSIGRNSKQIPSIKVKIGVSDVSLSGAVECCNRYWEHVIEARIYFQLFMSVLQNHSSG